MKKHRADIDQLEVDLGEEQEKEYRRGVIGVRKLRIGTMRFTFVLRRKEWYNKYAFGLWFKKQKGLGISYTRKLVIGKSPVLDKVIMYQMIGFYLWSILGWIEIKYEVKAKNNERSANRKG